MCETSGKVSCEGDFFLEPGSRGFLTRPPTSPRHCVGSPQARVSGAGGRRFKGGMDHVGACSFIHKEPVMTHLQKSLFASAALACGLVAFSSHAATPLPDGLAERQAARVDQRQDLQSDRITQGAASGQLTAREQARLEHQQRKIGRLERRTEADGQVTYREAARVERAQDHASRSIARQRHDR